MTPLPGRYSAPAYTPQDASSSTDIVGQTIDVLQHLAQALPPAPIAPLMTGLESGWLFDAAAKLSSLFHDLGTPCLGTPRTDDDCGFICDEVGNLTPVCASHVWLMALAQRGAISLCEDQQLQLGRSLSGSLHSELNTVALLAGCTNPVHQNRLLTTALAHVSRRFVSVFHARGVRAQFLYSKALSSNSPITKGSPLPFTACRVRAEGTTPETLLTVLRDSIRYAGGAANTPTGEVLIMSNLWLDPA
jgi:hypothetical protein